tara:strand:+ start:743 stop:1420 length:678 start_codon:yes stop_codon:yes gene_type:complete
MTNKKYSDSVIILDIAGGNSTALVESFTKDKKIVKRLLKDVEQVGFIYLDRIPKLEMMGDEFCVNATLAFAFQLKGEGKLRTSGIKKPINYRNKGSLTIIDIPLKYRLEKNVVLFAGIGFVMLDKKEQRKVSKKYLKDLAIQYKLPAFGAIIYEGNKIIPYVYVREIDSFVKETACGSGSIAFSIFSGVKKVIQPTGKVIKIKINKEVSVSAKVNKLSNFNEVIK